MKNDLVDIVSLLLQLLSLEILFKDYNNSDLMQELDNQDTYYLERIIKQNNEILNILKKGSDNIGK